MKKLKDTDYKILSELVKNSKISDRELAKKIDVSQSTVTRRRGRLESRGLLNYTAIPDFGRLGFEIIAVTLYAVKSELRFPKDTSKLESKILDKFAKISDKFYSENRNVIFAATGRGLDMNSVLISVHEDYSSLVEFLRKFEMKFGQVLDNIDTFTVSTRKDRIRRLFNLKYFADYVKKVKMPSKD